ncbi:MAG: efflux RND transporter periplasmic adaptor subunit [Casimicrobiaceae bacterium]
MAFLNISPFPVRRLSALAEAALALSLVSAWVPAPSLAALGQAGAYGTEAVPAVPGTITVGAVASHARHVVDAVVEAERQATLAAQVAGTVLEVAIRVGDRVRAGQVLFRIDARAAEQQARAGLAQAAAARAQRDLAAQEYARQRTLFERGFISKSALEQAEARWKATEAETNAQLAAAEVSRTQTDFHVVRAPFAGIVAQVPIERGDMAVPGRPLAVLYEPSALRVSANVTESLTRGLDVQSVRIMLEGSASEQPISPARVTVLPVADAATHTVQVRATLPDEVVKSRVLVPGAFARLLLTVPAQADKDAALAQPPRVAVPTSAVLRRAELDLVYIASPDGRPLLRIVRLGRRAGDQVEVLSGLAAGERIYVDAAQAATLRSPAR